jgi:hypothetical protein
MPTTLSSLALVIALTSTASCVVADEPSRCRDAKGELQLWNGWPPSVRIRTRSGEVYGLEGESPEIPDTLKAALAGGDGPVRGTFTVRPTGVDTSVPYDRKPIHLARLTAFVPSTAK